MQNRIIQFSVFLSMLMFSCHDEILMDSSTEINQSSSMEDDNAYLDSLYQEILLLSGSFDCINEANWTFTALGARACGGPEMYIAYSIKMDTVTFLNKVKLYTDSQRYYNDKWGIASICSVVTPPKGVICVDGKPIFVY